MGLLVLTTIILLGWAEITAFILIGGEVGGFLTFIGVFLTAVVGLWLLRRLAATVMTNLRQQVIRGETPLAAVAESLSLLIGGILLLIPGYVTDAVGLLLFVPGLRTVIGLFIISRLLQNARFCSFASKSGTIFDSHATDPQWTSQQQTDNTIIEGEAEEKCIDCSDPIGKKQ